MLSLSKHWVGFFSSLLGPAPPFDIAQGTRWVAAGFRVLAGTLRPEVAGFKA